MSSAGRVLARALSIHDRIAKMLAWLGGALIVAVMLMISVATVSRYFFGNALAEATELSAYSLLVITFFGAPHLARTHGHIAVDIVRNATKGGFEKSFDVVANAVSIAVCLVLAVYASRTAYQAYVRGETVVDILGTPKYLLFAVIALGFLLTAISFFSSVTEVLERKKSVECEGEEGA